MKGFGQNIKHVVLARGQWCKLVEVNWMTEHHE